MNVCRVLLNSISKNNNEKSNALNEKWTSLQDEQNCVLGLDPVPDLAVLCPFDPVHASLHVLLVTDVSYVLTSMNYKKFNATYNRLISDFPNFLNKRE